MEFKDVSEKIEWEAKRVAAALGVKGELDMQVGGPYMWVNACFGSDENYLEWRFTRPIGKLTTGWVYVKVAPMSDEEVEDWADMDNCVSSPQITYSPSRDAWYIEAFGKCQNECNYALVRGLY